MDMYVAATLLCMNMYVWTLMLWTCMNMYVWTLMCVSRHWLLAAYQQSWSGTNFYIYFCWLWLLLFLVFTTAEELALHELATNQTQQDYDLAVGNNASMWNVTPVNIGWTIGTPSRVNEILGQICWADNDEWQVQRERERERGHPLNAKCLKMFHLTYFLYCTVLAL